MTDTRSGASASMSAIGKETEMGPPVRAKAGVRWFGSAIAASCALAIGCVTCLAMLPLQAQATPAGQRGVGASSTQAYDGAAGSWDGDQGGRVRVSYGTVDGDWGQGRFFVTIPTKIAYDGMPAGTVSTSDSYTVNVRGAIAEDEQVTLVAETGQALSGGRFSEDITETTTQGKSTWSADEVYGGVTDAAPNDPVGTSCTDSIAMSGTARAASTYEGTVAYTARLGKGV